MFQKIIKRFICVTVFSEIIKESFKPVWYSCSESFVIQIHLKSHLNYPESHLDQSDIYEVKRLLFRHIKRAV